MSFVRGAILTTILLGATACSGSPHDLDLEDLQGGTPGATTGTGVSTGTGTSTGTNPVGGGNTSGGLTWNGDVGPAVVTNGCTAAACHDGAGTGGQYSLTSYAGATGPGADGTVPNVVAGDPNSLLYTKCLTVHNTCNQTISDLIYDWIVVDGAPQ